MKANVYVTLKQEVLDPQGEAVRRALSGMGFGGIKSARVGKLIEIEADADDKGKLEQQLIAMGEKLLSNPVIEDFRVEVVDD